MRVVHFNITIGPIDGPVWLELTGLAALGSPSFSDLRPLKNHLNQREEKWSGISLLSCLQRAH